MNGGAPDCSYPGCPMATGLAPRIERAEAEIDSLRVSRHDHGNAIVTLQERLLRVTSDIEDLQRTIEQAQTDTRTQNELIHADVAKLSGTLPVLSASIDRLRATLVGANADEDGGIRSRVGRMETSLVDVEKKLKWIQWGLFALIAILGPEQLKALVGTIAGVVK